MSLPFLILRESSCYTALYVNALTADWQRKKRQGYTVENSIYIDSAYQRQGVGKALLDHALKWAESEGYRQMIAVVGDSANVASVALHIRAGFTEIGTLKDIGFKHGRWLDTVLLQMKLGEGNSTLPEDSDLML